MDKKIRWGIMGTGRIAKLFCDTLRKLKQAEIYAIGSRNKETAEAMKGIYHAAVSYGSYEELVKDDKIDIIYVATPIGSHYENVKLCLKAGRNVLCEKAFTQKSAEAEELYKLSKENNLFLMEAMWTKCQPVFQKIMEWNKEGKLGNVQGVECKLYTKADTNHRLYRDKNQGGTLFDVSIYPITYACALLGYEPSQIYAMVAKGGDDVDTMESIQLQYEDGAFANLSGGLSPERQLSLYIHGTKGRILINQEPFHCAQKASLLNWENEIIEAFEQPFEVNGYEYEAIEAMWCIQNKKTESEIVPVEETIQVIRIMEACLEQWGMSGC